MSTDRETDARIKIMGYCLEIKNEINHIKDDKDWFRFRRALDKLVEEITK